MDKNKLLKWLERKINELENAEKRNYEEWLMFDGAKNACTVIYEYIAEGKFD
ncbi:hypothetical protein ABEV41_00750 [Geobacillus thermodenitrificans]|jgi:hypothetical protein|uniref:hypothetical protein n=1 Tax=Geobacillus thermodenitrificans TaxID=33940 RepID=UPI003D19DDFF